jgi:aldose sugar dehydrogenase
MSILRFSLGTLTLGLALPILHAQPATPEAAVQPVGKDSARPAARLITDMCASCHGANWEGGRAPSMLDDIWAHGGEDEDLAKSIRDGWPAAAMPPFGSVLSPQEIRALVVQIRYARANPGGRGRGGRGPAPEIADTAVKSALQSFKVEVITKDVRTPWGIAFLPDGRLLVSERGRRQNLAEPNAQGLKFKDEGDLKIIEIGKGVVETITGLPPTWVMQDGGVFDVAVHPKYAENGWVYLALSEPGPVPPGVTDPREMSSATRVVRGHIRDGKFVDVQDIFKAKPEQFAVSNIHYGSRFFFDKDGYLFFSIGERGTPMNAQDLTSPYGKLHRVFDDGRVPPDNPFVNTPGAVKSIWSYGHRNQQGITQHPVTGEIWADEHGPRGGDELNLIKKGHNYGWPVITYGVNDNGTPITDLTAKEGMDQPVRQFTPSPAVSALQFYTGDKYPKWKNSLFMATLVAQDLRRFEIDDKGKIAKEEMLFKNFGRVREVAQGPDGYLYVTINSQFGDSPGQVIRLIPTDAP